MADALQEELLSVPGVAGAEVESDEGMAGVRVQLAEGADAEAVGAAVRRILSSHGMRPAAADRVEPVAGPPPPPGAPGSIVTFPLVGEHARENDLEVNVTKGKKLTNIRAAGSDENILLEPAREVTLEFGLEFIVEDELLEVTPDAIRVRKRSLNTHDRKRDRKAIEARAAAGRGE